MSCPVSASLLNTMPEDSGGLQCNTLQHTATHCSAPQHNATQCNTMQHNATHCNTMQRTATQCNALQHTDKHCNTSAATFRSPSPFSLSHASNTALAGCKFFKPLSPLCFCHAIRRFDCDHPGASPFHLHITRLLSKGEGGKERERAHARESDESGFSEEEDRSWVVSWVLGD